MDDVAGLPDYRYGLDPRQKYFSCFVGGDALQGKMPANDVSLNFLRDELSRITLEVVDGSVSLEELREEAKLVLLDYVQRVRSVSVRSEPLRVEFVTADDHTSYEYRVDLQGP